MTAILNNYLPLHPSTPFLQILNCIAFKFCAAHAVTAAASTILGKNFRHTSTGR